jgi:nicotinamidase/pyrazinamidase
MMNEDDDRPFEFRRGDALLIVDVQRDFCPGGALPIESGDTVVPIVNDWIARAQEAGIPVFASRDWHPADHMSFKAQGGPWPPHCIKDTSGAAFHPALKLPETATIITKGDRLDREQYSAFHETNLATLLRDSGVRRLFIAGLAQDVCVRATALDARREGLDVHLVASGTRAITAESGAKALKDMVAAGVTIVQDHVRATPG